MRRPVEPFLPEAFFGRRAPLALDIGCGPGRFVAELAQARPHFNVLGLEIRPHLVESTCALIDAAKRAGASIHAHALVANVNLHLDQLLPNASISFVSVNFPDPWYKKRHHKRRVLHAAFLQQLLPKLTQDAEIHVMSDYEPIALAMREALDGNPAFVSIVRGGGWADHSTTGLTSEREQTHLARGEPIFRLAYRRQTAG